jgi:CheY-like chemotaxis protein
MSQCLCFFWKADSVPRLILIIDDDFDTRRLLRDRLTVMGFDVVAASSGHHGLGLLAEHASIGCQLDGILLNLVMPRLDGRAVLQKLQEHFAQIPVIIMASVPITPPLEEVLRQGARDIVMKPFDLILLQEKCLQHFIPSQVNASHNLSEDPQDFI